MKTIGRQGVGKGCPKDLAAAAALMALMGHSFPLHPGTYSNADFMNPRFKDFPTWVS